MYEVAINAKCRRVPNEPVKCIELQQYSSYLHRCARFDGQQNLYHTNQLLHVVGGEARR